ncbi:tumor protein D53 isoform X3 [Melopsittacus undulatus]|uniref:Uncharacterized protein n=1 Tax=Melopsittacus undulatus TaxID=13146 RepID=A0A8C6JVE8_MELUD|nr:tumor protein D53 isoform X3 [Melopsittacus undulatus]
MEPQAQGLLETQSLHEADDDVVTDVDFTTMISEEEKEELKIELAKLEDEISTLRQVLAAKEKHLVEIKQKLGVSLMNELKQNFSKSWHDVQTTSAYKKTHETLSHAGQKATAAISNVGTAISKKFGDMRLRLQLHGLHPQAIFLLLLILSAFPAFRIVFCIFEKCMRCYTHYFIFCSFLTLPPVQKNER